MALLLLCLVMHGMCLLRCLILKESAVHAALQEGRSAELRVSCLQMRLVTCRVLRRGQLHAVLFQDEQPPVVISNQCSADMEASPAHFPPQSSRITLEP